MGLIENVLDRGGGMIPCGNWLGVFVGSEANIAATPPGWVFCNIEEATPKSLREIVDGVKNDGRKAWPLKENGEAPR